MTSDSHINHGESRVYHQFRRNCISSKRSFVYHHCEKKCSLRLMIYTFGDEMHACAWWYTIAFAMDKKSASFFRNLPISGGEGETRTLAPVSRPTPLAGAPRHQLEYFCKCNGFNHYLIKKRAVIKLQPASGGESGIRTHGTLPYDGFQDRSVITTSVSLHMLALIYYHTKLKLSTVF